MDQPYFFAKVGLTDIDNIELDHFSDAWEFPSFTIRGRKDNLKVVLVKFSTLS
jgi:hypothetical protein